MAGKRVFKDPLMMNPAVMAYMDSTLKCPNSGRRRDIAVTVVDLALWKKVLDEWGYWQKTKKGQRWKRKNVFDVEGMLNEYELRMETGDANSQADSLSARSGERLSEGSYSPLSQVRSETERLYFGAGNMVRGGFSPVQGR